MVYEVRIWIKSTTVTAHCFSGVVSWICFAHLLILSVGIQIKFCNEVLNQASQFWDCRLQHYNIQKNKNELHTKWLQKIRDFKASTEAHTIIFLRRFNFITFSDGSSKAIIRTLGLQTGSSRAVTLTGSTLTFQTSTDSVGKTERGLRFILCSPSFNPYHLLSLSSFQFSLFPLSECEIEVNSFWTKPLHNFCFSLESGNSVWINLFILRGRECLKLFTFLMLDFELNILCKPE